MLKRSRLKYFGILILLQVKGISAQDGTFQPLGGSNGPSSKFIADKFYKTPSEKLKKIIRNVISYTESMQRTEVPDDEALRALPVVEGPENGRSSIRRAKQIRRYGTKMITGRIADRWLKKTTNIIKWIQKKFVSNLCNRFGNPDNADAFEVFGQKFWANYNQSDWAKYISQLVLDDGKTARAGPSQLRMDKPMTSIFLNYAKLRLWVEENLGACYDEAKIAEMKENGSKAAGARRIANWDAVAEKKFLRLESRLCKNINQRLLVRTFAEDNPYRSNPTCNSELFREKRREAINQEKKAEREAKRLQNAQNKEKNRAEKKNKKKNKS